MPAKGRTQRAEEIVWNGPRRILNLDGGGYLRRFGVEVPEGVRVVRLPSGAWALPERMTILLLDERRPKVDIDVELEGGTYVCNAIRRRRRRGDPRRPWGGPPLNTDRLRFAIERAIDDAVRTIAVALTEDEDGTLGGRWARRGGPEARAAFFAEYEDMKPARGRRKNRDHYEKVAELWHRANNDPSVGSPVKAIEEAMHATTPTANRWIGEARNLGLIPQPPMSRRRKGA